jgi:MoaA/NifB/PqqE/SkfB family radical SAM enzyme
MQIEPTTRCNFTCGFCAGRHMQQQDLDFSVFKKLIDSTNNLKHIELQGEGEPLLHAQFFEMIDYARARFPSLAVSFITNGSLFTAENIDRIIAANIHTILISIESTDEAEFQLIRGGKLPRVISGITNLVERKIALKSTLKVGFAVTVLKQTVQQINAIGDLYKQLHMDGGISIQPLQSMDCYTQFYSRDMRQSIPNGDDRIALNKLIATDDTLKYALKTYQSHKNFYTDLFTSVSPQQNVCAWLENGLYISAEGIATSCFFMKDARKNNYAPLADNLAEILGRRAGLSKSLKENIIPAQCQGCGIAHNIQRRAKPGITS